MTVPAEALRVEHLPEREYGSILVPLWGTRLDEDIVQTAALLVAGKPTDEDEIDSSTIEAVWIFEMPMSLPLDARLPDAQIKHASRFGARQGGGGGVHGGAGGHGHDQGQTSRTGDPRGGAQTRRGGDRARRRGAFAHSRRCRVLGDVGGPLENFVGDVTKYVVRKAQCRVIVTAPSAPEEDAQTSVLAPPASPPKPVPAGSGAEPAAGLAGAPAAGAIDPGDGRGGGSIV